MTEYEGPNIRVLWNKTPKARRPHLCDRCGEEIAPGAVYKSVGYTEDGEFKAEKLHRWAYEYPSGCPRFRERDFAEIAAADTTTEAAGTTAVEVGNNSPARNEAAINVPNPNPSLKDKQP